MSGFEIFAVTPPSYMVRGQLSNCNGQEQSSPALASVALAAAAAGHVGIIDIQFLDWQDSSLRQCVLDSLRRREGVPGFTGVKCGVSQLADIAPAISALSEEDKQADHCLILVPDSLPRGKQLDGKNLARDIAKLKKAGLRVLLEVVSAAELTSVEKLGVDGIIAKGYEAAGLVGEQTTFVLLQQCLKQTKLPVFAEGGIGLHTAAACFAAGAKGAVLDSQLLLARESQVPFELKLKIEQMDGTETSIVNLSESEHYRFYVRPNHPISESLLNSKEAGLKSQLLNSVQDENPLNWAFPLGQDVALAASLAKRYLSVAGILEAISRSVQEHVSLAKQHKPLAPNSPLAKSHGCEFPIVQGAMTRVSDTAEFAFEVAKAGGLPFLALSLMRKGESDRLLSETSKQLGNLPWGVGILGFVPTQLRQEQIEVIQAYKPPYALIAGGRPDQAKFLEDQGIKTYLHVPSPLLLSSFIEMGSRRFVFEGRECGGHVGPRSSFVLWEAMIDRLLENIGSREDAGQYHVLFAGGVHDELSSCMVATMAATLADKGVKVGALMGTAYLFTEEAVTTGAIVKKFQEAAIGCSETVLLETGPGHAIRCIGSPYKKTFDDKRKTLLAEGKGRDQVREELELMNLGRLRIASKGLTRGPSLTKDQIITEMSAPEAGTGNGQKLEDISEDKQWSEGMYMIGQVAAMHDAVLTIKQLHENVSAGGSSLVQSLDFREESRDLSLLNSIDEKQEDGRAQEGIAIIGMSCLLPKAKDVESYWQNILNKVDTIEEVPIEQWDWRNYYDADPQARDKIYSKWGGFLESIEFDPTKYGIPPSSLASIDPMQILLLEVTDLALKDAGYENRPFQRERTSVILANAGHGPITALYSLRSMLGWKLADLDPQEKAKIEARLPEWTEDSFPGYLGNVTAGRVANRFDLGGINFSIDAACASSLAALHTAVGELRSGNSDMVLLSATDTHNQPGDYLSFSKTHAFSGTGRCKTFDSQADGIVISEGMAMLVLKRVSDAKRDGDRIYAVIKGIGGSSDGRDLSLTAPRPAGQVKALVRAYHDANISPSTVTLVEAHGTGTVAGDRAEVEALKRVYEYSGAPERSCAIGSVKTMIGHTKAAAGLASLIKVAKALYHKVLPPTIGVSVPSPACHFEKGPFYINSEARPWLVDQPGEQPLRRAGVSAFGFGGTNFHAVVEEYVPDTGISISDASELPMPAELFLFYGRNPSELIKSLTTLGESVKRCSQEERESRYGLAGLAHSCYLKNVEWLSQRSKGKGEAEGDAASKPDQCLAIVASSMADLEEKLNRAKGDLLDSQKTEIKDPRGIYYSRLESPRSGKVAFVFPGQGSQQINMLGPLAMQFHEVKQAFESANEILAGSFDKPLSQFVYPPPSFTEEEEKRYKQELTDTKIAQPAIGAADVAVLKLLSSFGLQPDMVAGHSYGEYVALFAGGSLNLADLLKISRERGRLLSQAAAGAKGAMAAVSGSASDLKEHLKSLSGTTIANINSPNQCVIAGSEESIEAAVSLLKEKGISAKRIAVSQAFHSAHMQPACAELKKALASLSFQPAKVAVYSNTEGKAYGNAATEFVEKLTNHIVKPVDFVTEIKNMHADGADVFIEVGPGNVLTGLVESILKDDKALALAVDRPGRNGVVNLLHVLGQLASRGIKVDLSRLYSSRALLLAKQQAPAVVPAGKGATAKRLLYTVNSVGFKRLDKNNNQPASQSKDLTPTTKQVNQTSKHQPVDPTTAATAGTTQKAPSLPTQEDKIINTNRPASMPARPTSPQLRPQQVQAPVARQSVSEQSGRLGNAQVPAPMGASRPKANTSAIGSADQVMIEFQKTMLQMTDNFLKTQQNVMLAYLKAQQGGGQMMALPQVFENGGSEQNFEERMPRFRETTTTNWSVTAPVASEYVADQRQDYVPANGASDAKVAVASTINLAPAESTPLPEAVPESSNGKDYDPEFLVTSLLDIVSQRTGYPTDMLDPNLDLEADLGIDSIKRVEILNSFRRILPEAKQKQLESGIEELAGTKTLQGIIDWLRSEPPAHGQPAGERKVATHDGENGNGNGKHGDSLTKAALAEITSQAQSGETVLPTLKNDMHVSGNGHNGSVSGNGHHVVQEPDTSGSNIKRGLTKVTPLPAVESPNGTASDVKKQAARVAIITADKGGMHEALAKTVQAAGLIPVVLEHDPKSTKAQTVSETKQQYRFDMTDSNALQTMLEQVEKVFGEPRSILHLQSLGSASDGQWTGVRDSALVFFLLIKHLGAGLTKRAAEFASGIVAATNMGGKFGLEGTGSGALWSTGQASIAGIVKSAEKELKINCKVVDFEAASIKASSKGQQEVASRLFAELCAQDSITEVGYLKNGRFGLAVENIELDQASLNGSNLNGEAVILVTGGARGITAEVALELAERYKPRLIIVGRSERPQGPEDSRFAGLETPREVKGAIIEQLKEEGKQVSIPVVESRYQSLVGEREIRNNLEKLQATGARVEYHALDVRDKQAVSKLVKRLYDAYGNINAVIHGAGVIEDAYIKDKSPESFLRVFETKVLGAYNLAESLRLETLDYLLLFSSVVGRTGNAGQADYVAANEVVNKLALNLNSKVRGRAASIMWGPWKGGMAQPELESIFASYGWAMIDKNAGRRALTDEILMGKRDDIEVLLVAELDKGTALEAKGAKLKEANLRRMNNGDYEFSFELNTQTDLFLADHTFDGVPVMPMAFALEFMSEAVTSVYPNCEIQMVENMDIPSGIVFEKDSKAIFITVHEEENSGTRVRASASLSSGLAQRRVNFKVNFVLDVPGAARSVPGKLAELTSEPKLKDVGELVSVPPLSEIYGQWLFHGPIFQGIKEIQLVGANGAFGSIEGSRPRSSFRKPGDSSWCLDPIMLDSAMQVGGVWARRYLDITVLPTGFRRLHNLAKPAEGRLTVRVFIAEESTAQELTCDVAVIDRNGQIVWFIEGLGGVGSKSLNRLSGGGIGIGAGR